MEQMCDEDPGWTTAGFQMTGSASEVVRAYLDHVNTAQNERLAEASAEPTPSRGTAHGAGGRARSKSSASSSTTPSGNVLAAARAGDALTIRIRYHAKNPVAQPVFGLGFTTGERCAGCGPEHSLRRYRYRFGARRGLRRLRHRPVGT